MKPTCLSFLILPLVLTGCDSAPTADQVVPIAEIPQSLMEKARKELPGITFDTAYKMKVNGVDAYFYCNT